MLDASEPSLLDAWRTVLRPIASLQVTVVLFALAILIVLAGTLAQTRMDISTVIDGYFRTAVARIEFQALLPQSFFPRLQNVPGYFYFPGGWLIGSLMAINLLAAHLIRFKIQASGARLVAGTATIVLGMALTGVVIASGSNKGGIQGVSMISFSSLWIIMQASLAATWLAMAYALARLGPRRKLEFWSLIGGLTALGMLLGWIVTGGESVALNDSSMRIVWQLAKGGLAGIVLLAGCVLVFKKRAGVVLLHAGIGLMMFSELLVGTTAKEALMIIPEGMTVNYVQDSGVIELAVIDSSDSDHDDVVVIPEALLTSDARIIKHDDLPFDLRVLEYLKNSQLIDVGPNAANLATAGSGKSLKAIAIRESTGTDTDSSVDMASAYVELIDKKNHQSLGSYLVTPHLLPQQVSVGDKIYKISLRFKRTYKPYSMHLTDVVSKKYMGTTTPMDYRSKLQLVDEGRNIRQNVEIWMNNPLRFAGETFYQSGYSQDPRTGKETTTLQVVTNTGWMIPYVSCMIVGVGMLAHFSVILLRFLRRRAEMPVVTGTSQPNKSSFQNNSGERLSLPESDFRKILGIALPVAMVVLVGGLIVTMARPAADSPESMHIGQFGSLPVVYEGRIKPFDTIARNSLRAISDRESFVDSQQNRHSATEWLLGVISGSAKAKQYEVIRIENLDVLNTLGLERKEGFRYCINDVVKNLSQLVEQIGQAQRTPKSQQSLHQKKLLELDAKLRRVIFLSEPFFRPSFFDPQMSEAERKRSLAFELERRKANQKNGMVLPRAVPPLDPQGEWHTLRHAEIDAIVAMSQGRQTNPAPAVMRAMLTAYRSGNAKTFNDRLAEYQQLLEAKPPKDLSLRRTSFESYYNHFAPLNLAMWIYLGAFVLAALSWLGWSRPLGRASFWVIVLALGIHTFGLAARMVISDRIGVTVTNLYSSAVFISWGCVVLGLILELIYRIGVGNIVASLTGCAALMVAWNLAKGSDTFVVMQAVLDTNFWLATHVTCISLGYATTFLAGFLGIAYVLLGVATAWLTPKVAKDLNRMIYGTVCFAIFFSFIGTVLGGLWADDSWGRFWGWDPKENGALMIVLWNALALHARWGGMVRPRGFALLVIFGNVITAWSWFGVNQLGAGLHSYGFTEGVQQALVLFGLIQLIVIGIGMVPQAKWWSFLRHTD